MKNRLSLIRKNNFMWILFITCLLLFNTTVSYSQDTTVTAPTKYEVSLDIAYYKNDDTSRVIQATISRMENRQRIYLPGEKINFYVNEQSENNLIGNVITDKNGIGKFQISNNKLSKIIKGTLSEFIVFASLNNSEKCQDQDVSMTIQEAKLEVKCYEEDSIKYIKATLNNIDSIGNLIPAEDIEVHFFIQRMFSLLPIGGDYTYTNENGEISIEFPKDLVGNREGHIDVFVKIEDDENFGNLSMKVSNNWGIPLEVKSINPHRALWESRANAPISLLIIANLIIFGVWLTICYLILQLFKIKKISKN